MATNQERLLLKVRQLIQRTRYLLFKTALIAYSSLDNDVCESNLAWLKFKLFLHDKVHLHHHYNTYILNCVCFIHEEKEAERAKE